MVCFCCGLAGKNARGCSCGGGKSHVCRKNIPTSQGQIVVSNRQISPIMGSITPKFDDIWSIAAINADASNRKDIVGTWEALGEQLSDYVSIRPNGLKKSSDIVYIGIVSNKGSSLIFRSS